jgi:N-acetylglucosamine-6-phosphate deacetylase
VSVSDTATGIDRDMLLHSHGVDEVDFSSMSAQDLRHIQQAADRDNFCIIPTIFLRQCFMSDFERVLKEFSTSAEEYPAVVGFAVEGPMLGRSGGVPSAGCWSPTAEEWLQIAGWGNQGLKYMVIGPDAMDIDDELESGLRFRDLIDTFYANGVILALGHFQHDDPELSARRTETVIDHISHRFGGSPNMLITDHLFNDMPRNFVHAWRTEESRLRRDEEIRAVRDEPWTDASITQILGPVPATLLLAARAGKLTPVLNFDGEHVDLDICRLVVDFLGPDRLMAITDSTDLDVMAGEPLHSVPGSSLKYRGDGVVAAGSTNLAAQRRHMSDIGLSASAINSLIRSVPQRVLAAPR